LYEIFFILDGKLTPAEVELWYANPGPIPGTVFSAVFLKRQAIACYRPADTGTFFWMIIVMQISVPDP
jgi:hypothetical protein